MSEAEKDELLDCRTELLELLEWKQRQIVFKEYPETLRLLETRDAALGEGDHETAYLADLMATAHLRIGLMEKGGNWLATPEWAAWREMPRVIRPERMHPPNDLPDRLEFLRSASVIPDYGDRGSTTGGTRRARRE
jgi:hypothetical protein